MITVAEIKVGGEWVTIDFAEGVKRRGQAMRFPACEGPMNPYDGGGSVPHFAHIKKHEHCPLYYRFSGTPKRHPDALA